MKSSKYFDKAISIITSVVAIMLVIYMIVLVVVTAISFTNVLIDLAKDMMSGANIVAPDFTALSVDFLHGIAIFIILIKAYKVLVSYAEHHHVSIRYIAEIAIIAGVLEILFNTGSYSWEVLAVMSFLSVSSLAIYVWKYPVFEEIDSAG